MEIWFYDPNLLIVKDVHLWLSGTHECHEIYWFDSRLWGGYLHTQLILIFWPCGIIPNVRLSDQGYIHSPMEFHSILYYIIIAYIFNL